MSRDFVNTSVHARLALGVHIGRFRCDYGTWNRHQIPRKRAAVSLGACSCAVEMAWTR